MKNLLKSFNNFTHMVEVLPTDDSCRKYLEKVRWNGVPICPHCGVCDKDHYNMKIKGKYRGLRRCRHCSKSFTVTVGTMFEGSHIGLRKWFIALFLFSSHKKGISSYQIARDLGITQKSAWFMLSRIRHCYKQEDTDMMSGQVQVDETFIGGKNKNRHANKRVKESQGRSVKDKVPVIGLFNNGKVHTEVISSTKANILRPIVEAMVEEGSIVVTDEWKAYGGLRKRFKHKVVTHSTGQYVRDGYHTNSIENFWSLLKRGLYGIYHKVSRKHLKKYCDEFSFRFNTRQMIDSDRFIMSLVNTRERLTYNELIGKVA